MAIDMTTHEGRAQVRAEAGKNHAHAVWPRTVLALLDRLDELDPPPVKKAESGDMPLYVRCRESRDSLRGGAEEGGMFTAALVIELLDHLDELDPPRNKMDPELENRLGALAQDLLKLHAGIRNAVTSAAAISKDLFGIVEESRRL